MARCDPSVRAYHSANGGGGIRVLECARRHRLALAECLAYAQRYDEALVVYKRVIALDPVLRARATINYARALVFLERAEEAFAALAGFEGKDANELRAVIRDRLG